MTQQKDEEIVTLDNVKVVVTEMKGSDPVEPLILIWTRPDVVGAEGQKRAVIEISHKGIKREELVSLMSVLATTLKEGVPAEGETNAMVPSLCPGCHQPQKRKYSCDHCDYWMDR